MVANNSSVGDRDEIRSYPDRFLPAIAAESRLIHSIHNPYYLRLYPHLNENY